MNDERLAQRAAKGDRRAFEAIYRRYGQDLYRFCLAMVGNPQDAQDALQNTMVKVLRALPGEQRRIQLRPWLYRIARNEAVETIRRRRDDAELEPEQAGPAPEIAATAEMRDRLRDLLADLEELPARQRAVLVMREMGDLGFEQIGESLGTSAAVARQALYEARLSLRQMDAGREMGCDAVKRELSDADGRVTRRREIRAHLRACPDCRAFSDAIAERQGGFAAIAPLPLALSVGLLQGALGAGGAAAATGTTTAVAVKSAAAVVAVAAVGVTAADRSGLVDTPIPGGERAASPPRTGAPPPRGAAGVAGAVGGAGIAPGSPGRRAATPRGGEASSGGGARGTSDRHSRGRGGAVPAKAAGSRGQGHGGGHGRHRGKPDGLPAASTRGQETAAKHKAPQAKEPPGPGGSPPGGAGSGSASKPAPPSPPAKPTQAQAAPTDAPGASPPTKAPPPAPEPESKAPPKP